MVNFLNKLGGSKSPEEDLELPPAKRISTPAGQRLSTILDYGSGITKSRTSVISSGRITPLPELFDEEASKTSAYTTTSVWSEGDKLTGAKLKGDFLKKGGRKRLALIVAVVIAVIIGLAVGLAVGLKKKSSHSSSSSSASPTSTSSALTTPLPSNFPVGSYSFITFLDSSYADCAANSAAWTCYPYTTYYASPSAALTVFNWAITAKSGSSNSYQISSIDNSLNATFSDVDLNLDSAGTDSEHYTFQMTMSKTVTPSSNLTADDSPTVCYFNQTTFQAYLYTSQASTYPSDQVTVTGAPYTQWPFHVRIEQVAGAGPDVPNCYTSAGVQINGLDVQDASQLCSCLYKNWVTPV